MNLQEIKQRIFYGWNFLRAVYVLMGLTIVIQAAVASQTVGVFLGGYFAYMGIMGNGCASGNCYYPPQARENKTVDVGFEEINDK